MSSQKGYCPPWEEAFEKSTAEVLEGGSPVLNRTVKPKLPSGKFQPGNAVKSGAVKWRTEDRLRTSARLKRVDFVNSFFIDYNPIRAACRLGMNYHQARKQSAIWLKEPYVLQLIAEREAKFTDECKELKERVMSRLWKEANDEISNDGSVRVRALTQLCKVLGMERNLGNEGSVTQNILIVPSRGSVDDWEKAAEQSQNELKMAVRQ